MRINHIVIAYRVDIVWCREMFQIAKSPAERFFFFVSVIKTEEESAKGKHFFHENNFRTTQS